MRTVTTIRISNIAGLGPAAWDQDIQKASMHPPIPGHIEFVQEHAEENARQHHVIQRKHPENDRDETLVATQIPRRYLLAYWAGKT